MRAQYPCIDRKTAVCSDQIDVTDKSASIRTSFSVRAAAEELARKLSGVTVKIKGVKLHAFVRVSEGPLLPHRR